MRQLLTGSCCQGLDRDPHLRANLAVTCFLPGCVKPSSWKIPSGPSKRRKSTARPRRSMLAARGHEQSRHLGTASYGELRTAPDCAWVMGRSSQSRTSIPIRSGVTCDNGTPFRNGCSEICVLVTQPPCVPLSMKRLSEAIRQPRGHVRGSVLSHGCTLTWASLVPWVRRTGHECIGPALAQQGDWPQPVTQASIAPRRPQLGHDRPLPMEVLRAD